MIASCEHGLGGLNWKGAGLFAAPFAPYGSFLAFFCGALPNAVVMTIDLDTLSRRLFCHLNHCKYNSFLKKNFWYHK
jgi:hypothetical protein